jgi:hypothetical protein
MQKPGNLCLAVLTLVMVARVAAQQAPSVPEAVALLHRAIANDLKLPLADVERLRVLLLSKPANPNAVPLDLALGVLKLRQMRDTFELHDVVSFVFLHWAKDPRVIAFYRDALAVRGPAAVDDLSSSSVEPWDASFIEMVTRVAEGSVRSSYDLLRPIGLMDRHYDSWAQDASIARRLGQVVRKAQAASETDQSMYQWFQLAGQTHDRSLIAVLRPYLADSRLERYTSWSANMPGGVTPMRYSELAANAICRLIGEPMLFDPWKRAKAPKDGPYPEWREWDRKIAELRTRLDRMKLVR